MPLWLKQNLPHTTFVSAFALLIFASKLAFIHGAGTDVPQMDQWDAEAHHTLVPWLEHRLTPTSIVPEAPMPAPVIRETPRESSDPTRQTFRIERYLATLPFNGLSTGTANWATFSEITFSFRFGPRGLAQGIIMAALMGLLGGLFPAIRAVRMNIVTALREQ